MFRRKLVFLLTIGLVIFNLSVLIPNSKSDTQKVYKEFTYSEEEISNFIYSYKIVPDDFYYEIVYEEGNYSSYFVYPGILNESEYTFFSTNNFTEAHNLILQFLQKPQISAKNITTTYENEKFFEFQTERLTRTGSLSITKYRIHKSSYIYLNDISYSTWESTLRLGQNESLEIGFFKQTPINTTNIKELVGYLWFMKNWMMGGHVVADYVMSTDNATISVILLETQMTVGDWGIYDSITLVYSHYSINITSGEISLYREAFSRFNGKYHPNPFSMSTPQDYIIIIIFSILIGCYVIFKIIRKFKKNSRY